MHALLTLPFFHQLADLSLASSSALIAAIWQGAFLAAIAALALRLVPRIPAAARFAIWFAVFTLIAILPFAAFTPHRLAPPSSSSPTHAWLSIDSRWTLAIAGLWAAASLLRAATLIAAALRVRSLSRNATPLLLPHSPLHAPATASRRAQRCVSANAQLCASTDVDRPTVIGFFAPKILIPAWLLEKLTPAELDHIVLHESGHLSRADDWLNLLQKLALVLFPLNPALAWVERRLCFERELACDERVLNILASRNEQSARAAAGYASSLATLAEYRLQRKGLIQNLSLALGALGSSARQSELGRRIARILRPATRMKPLHTRLATGAAIAALLFTTTELEHTPQLISFASPAQNTQLASAAASPNTLLPGYQAIAARLTLPAEVHSNSIKGVARRLAAQPHTFAPESRVVSVHMQHTGPTPRMVSIRQPEQHPDLVITRYTVTSYQSDGGYRIVRTSAVIADAPPAAPYTDQYPDASTASDGQPAVAASRRPRQISQPYAAVPVPGGWLVFQL